MLVTLIKEKPSSSETSVLRRAHGVKSPDAILHSHRRENHTSYMKDIVKWDMTPFGVWRYGVINPEDYDLASCLQTICAIQFDRVLLAM
jgi:hypothetical protein